MSSTPMSDASTLVLSPTRKTFRRSNAFLGSPVGSKCPSSTSKKIVASPMKSMKSQKPEPSSSKPAKTAIRKPPVAMKAMKVVKAVSG